MNEYIILAIVILFIIYFIYSISPESYMPNFLGVSSSAKKIREDIAAINAI